MKTTNDQGVKEVTADACTLACFECESCGFHIGIDATWLTQTHEPGLQVPCPCCNAGLFIAAED